MKCFFLIACYLFISNLSFSQDFSKEFATLISKGRTFYDAKDYKNSGLTFFSAFRLPGVVPSTNDRLRAAYSWSLGGFPDSAFSQLNLIDETKGLTFDEVNDILLDEDFTSLQADSRCCICIRKR